MTEQARADEALAIGQGLQGRLAMDIMRQTADPHEALQLASASIVVLLRTLSRGLPIDRDVWLSEIVRAVVA